MCEVYEIVNSEDADASKVKKLKRINEVSLYKEEGKYYSGSKDTKERGGHLARGSMACNGQILLWRSACNIHVYDFSNGLRLEKNHETSTAWITYYDVKDKYFFALDCCSYSWLKQYTVEFFEPKNLNKPDS